MTGVELLPERMDNADWKTFPNESIFCSNDCFDLPDAGLG
jgi:hypothetical protein